MKKHYLLFYRAAENYATRRLRFRGAHLRYAWDAHMRGDLVLAGALADPVDGAVLLFESASPDAVESFARADPYVLEGIVSHWEVREWTTVVGDHAASPLRPEDA